MGKMTAVILILLLLAGLSLGVYYVEIYNTGKKELRVFAAGSLAVPFKELNEKFEEKYNAKVYLETAGSIQTVKKISDLHMPGDIVAVADYNAIKEYLMPNYTSWFIKFAKNEIVLVYTSGSRYGGKINSQNWYEILENKEVRIGFSSPNDDPCGYRTLMALYLSDIYYGKSIFENVVENNTGIKIENSVITVPDDSSLLNGSTKIFIKQKSVDLLADLETGNIDYAFEYLSVAKQHNLNYIRFPDEINLSNSSLSSNYSKAVVKLADGKTVKGDAINYAITIPETSKNRELALEYIEMLIGDVGKNILEKCGQIPMYEAVGNVPKELNG